MHDTVSLKWPGEEGKLFSRAGKALQRAAAVITVSNYSKQCIVEKFKVDPGRIQVIYNGCDQARFRPDYPVPEIEAGLDQLGVKAPYLLYIGGQSPRKNLPCLISAFSRAKLAGNLPHSLVLAGPLSFLKPEVLEAIASNKMKADLKVLGYVPE